MFFDAKNRQSQEGRLFGLFGVTWGGFLGPGFV